MKRDVLLMLSAFVFTNIVSAQKLHTIIFADTQDEKIGIAAQVSLNRYFNSFLGIVEECLGDSYKRTRVVCSGYECNKDNLLKTINNLSCGEEDIVVFIYVGHGARGVDDWSDFPQMCFALPKGARYRNEEDFYPLENVRNLIKKKNPRFCLVIGDCCNSYSPSLSTKGEVGAASASIERGRISSRGKEIIKRLFLSKRGDIMLTASEKGAYGWCTTKSDNPSYLGMFMERHIYELFLEILYGTAEFSNWNDLLETVRDNTYIYSTTANCTTTENGRTVRWTQKPYYKINIDGESATPGESKPTIAEIRSVRVTPTDNADGEKGIDVHVDFNVQNMKGQDGRVVCYFYDSKGNALIDTNDNYHTSDGKVSSGSDIKPRYDNSRYDDYIVSIPGSELHLTGENTRTLKVDVVVWNHSRNPHTIIGRKDDTSFTFTPEQTYLKVNGGTSDLITRFTAPGGRETYTVNTNANDFETWGVPSWCSIENKTSSGFTLVCRRNTSTSSLDDYMKVKAAGKEIRIDIKQEASSGPSATITSVEQTHNCIQGSSKGMKIKLKFDVSGMKNRTVKATAWFYYDDNTTQLKNKTGGQVSVSDSDTAPYENTTFTMTLFLPYQSLNMAPGFDGPLSFDVVISDSSNKTLTREDNNKFTYSQPSSTYTPSVPYTPYTPYYPFYPYYP